MALITCRELTLSYEGQTVVSELSFSVNRGDYLCIVGENGSGKSTLIKALVSLKRADKGTICFGDGLKKTEIGYLPQQTDMQKDFPASVREVVLSGCLNKKGLCPFYSRKDKERARSRMAKLGLDGLTDQPYRNLSGGQQQRVLLARALCAAEQLIVLDEPVSGLDPLASGELYQIISEINRMGITVIMVSHDIQKAVRCATHILHLQNMPLFFGTAADYRRSSIGRRFLGDDSYV